MLFELNRKRCIFRNLLHNLKLADANFESAGSALLRTDLPRDDDARFLRQSFESFKRPGAFLQRAHTLNDSGAVTKNWKDQLAGLAQIVEPALDRDFLAVEFPCLFDRDCRHRMLFRVRSNSSV